MFRGSLPNDLCRIIREQASYWTDVTDVYVGCSGNFTIERTLADAGFKLHGNDIQTYSSAIGAYLSGQPFRCVVEQDYDDRFGWLNEYMDTPEGTLATILLAQGMLQGVNNLENLFYERMRVEYKRDWERLHSKTIEKIQALDVKLESYFNGDVLDFVKATPKDQAFVTFPPFFAGDYESQFKGLDMVFDWDRPNYEILDENGIQELLDGISSHKHWLVGNNVRREELEQYLVGRVQTGNRGVTIWVYASDGPKRIVMPRQTVEPIKIPHIRKEEVLGDKLTLAPLSTQQFSALRSRYMNANIKPGTPSLALAVLCDGVFIGACAYSYAPTLSNWSGHVDMPTVYLLSDFPVSGTAYKRLSKLIVYAAMSKEARMLTDRGANKRFRSIVTTAFSPRPVSMKYRGIMKVLNRTQLGEADPSKSPAENYVSSGYSINYGNSFGDWTLEEALSTWKAKHL